MGSLNVCVSSEGILYFKDALEGGRAVDLGVLGEHAKAVNEVISNAVTLPEPVRSRAINAAYYTESFSGKVKWFFVGSCLCPCCQIGQDQGTWEQERDAPLVKNEVVRLLSSVLPPEHYEVMLFNALGTKWSEGRVVAKLHFN